MLGIATVLAMAYFAFRNLRVRELVTRYARDYCRDRDLQFLDGTASITAISPTQLRGKLMLQRTYRFEYTDNGANRRERRYYRSSAIPYSTSSSIMISLAVNLSLIRKFRMLMEDCSRKIVQGKSEVDGNSRANG